MKQTEYIYRVTFTEPPIDGDARSDFYFYSLLAIYETFKPEQIGCRVEHLWNIGVSKGTVYTNRRETCTVQREPIARKHHVNLLQE